MLSNMIKSLSLIDYNKVKFGRKSIFLTVATVVLQESISVLTQASGNLLGPLISLIYFFRHLRLDLIQDFWYIL